MKEESILKRLSSWFKWRIKSISLVGLLMANYILVAALKHISLDSIWYSAFLGCFVGGFIALIDLQTYDKKYKAIYKTYQMRHYSLEDLPVPTNEIEAGYKMIIEALHEEYNQMQCKIRRQTEEANDYYTLWTHQIKTPIAAMQLILQNQKYEKPEEKNTTLQLQGELYKVEQYVEMALQYLRLESMTKDLMLKPYDLYQIVIKALQKLAVSFMNKKLSIEVQPFHQKIVTDEKWLQFVLEQIISNSIKYTYRGGITIRMNENQQLEIRDTGIGIRQEDLPRIFEKGFTGYNGRLDKKSTGIGLYLCKKVMLNLSHSLSVTSKIGVGTSFYIGFLTPQEDITLQK